MSIRTLVEVNHDQLSIMENDPDFGRKLSRAVREAFTSPLERNEVNGCARVVHSQHHSATTLLRVQAGSAKLVRVETKKK